MWFGVYLDPSPPCHPARLFRRSYNWIKSPIESTNYANQTPHCLHRSSSSLVFFNICYVPSPLSIPNMIRFPKLLRPHHTISSHNATSLTYIFYKTHNRLYSAMSLIFPGIFICLVSGMNSFTIFSFHYLLSIVFLQGYFKTRTYVLVLWNFLYIYMSEGRSPSVLQRNFCIHLIVYTRSIPGFLFSFSPSCSFYFTLTSSMVLDLIFSCHRSPLYKLIQVSYLLTSSLPSILTVFLSQYSSNLYVIFAFQYFRSSLIY